MTKTPITIGHQQPLARAHEVMRDHRVRHLPVLKEGELVGVVSQRDLYFIETLKGVDPAAVPVEEAMAPDPFTVQIDEPLGKVVETMAEKRYGSAVVLDGKDVAGIFTTVDALALLHDLLGERKAGGERSGKRAKARRGTRMH
jgi:acetoin utilization protein AcuB